MASPRCSVAVLVLIFCAFAYTAVYDSLPSSVNPCAHTLPRTLLAVTGLDPYVVSCPDDDASTSLLSDGGRDKNAGRVGGPIVTDLQQCRKPEGPGLPALPRTDPRSFYQQANIHCAHCTGTYWQVGYPELAVQIHYSWLFFPFHRAYICK
ncbi:hypothetical protein E2562_027500 [Oryza meyeriana var. granulata]|uniref:Tyrosinase copper-binding domain-containing protein n=1 Tax=Oryza meyeriana var. granulata TaxID=110450 RepID=A0A6G1E2F0_9ORYZ|nr:hypothetical protein E2562_027500 [Oryza meyeriana var. granulata]